MKVLALLSLACLVAAEPQLMLPYTSTPLITLKTGEDVKMPLINQYMSTYPYAGINWPFNNPWAYHPIIATAKPAENDRAKRSADADPEADPFFYTTTYARPWTTHAAITPYTYPYTQTAWPFTGYPYTYPMYTPTLLGKPKANDRAVESARKRRDADPEPEADPSTIFTYPTTTTYGGFPLTGVTGISSLPAYSRFPTTYTGLSTTYMYGNYPVVYG